MELCQDLETRHAKHRARAAVSPYDVVFSTWRLLTPLCRGTIAAASCALPLTTVARVPGELEKCFSRVRLQN